MPRRDGNPPRPNATLLGAALAIAPAAVGCAVGMLLAEKMKSKSRQRTASGLLVLGAVATAPLLIDYITKTINSPSFPRGSSKKLEGIRQSGVNVDPEVFGGGADYFLEEYQEAK